MECTSKVGDQVVCIVDGWRESWDVIPEKPVRNQLLTIRNILIETYNDREKGISQSPAYHFLEIVNPIIAFTEGEPREIAFPYRCFKPLDKLEKKDEKKTSIDIFKKMLGPETIKIAKKEVEKV